MKLVKKKTVDNTTNTTNFKYTDLRQIADYSRPITIFYSGVEYEAYLDGCYNMGVRNFLISYEYLKARGSRELKKYKDMHLFVDSGAYTYMNNPQYSKRTVKDWEEHIKAYLNWAKGHRDSIFAMAELDLQTLVGYDVVQQWRHKYFEPFMLETGILVCFIYHNEGLDIWEDMCRRYPYTGFSSANAEGMDLKLSEYRNMLQIAEKHNTLVHGFGMTRTSLLPETPFYTVDSTSWKAGFRYGQVAVWNGKRIQMFRKDAFEEKVFPILRNYNDITFDEDKIRKYYEPEILRVNTYAYLKAEEFIKERLKPLMYWQRAKAVTTDLNNLPSDFFPPPEYFDSNNLDGLDIYAKKFNINPECAELGDLVHGVTTFLNWDKPEYQKLQEWYLNPDNRNYVDKIHDMFINRVAPNFDAELEDLRKFFIDCVSGKNDRLLQLGTNFDRTVKERDSYIEEDEEVLIDVDENFVKERLREVLPTDNDEETEISALDEEIFDKAALVPVYDKKGRIVRAQALGRKRKKIYSEKFPKFACDTCYAASKCPEYQPGYVCAYQKMFQRFNTRNMDDIIDAIEGMAEHNLARMQRAMVIEVINGAIDPQVTSFIDQNMRLMNTLVQLKNNQNTEVLKQTRIVRADGTKEEVTQLRNPQSGGVLAQIFGGMGNSKSTDEDEKTSEENKSEKNERYLNIED